MKRASTILEDLDFPYGVPQERLTATGKGETELHADRPEANENRRVQIVNLLQD